MASNQTISWFHQRYKEGTLELSPDFQRNPVWLAPQKNYLIETILLELPVPELYYVNKVTVEGDSKCIVVDGQQRLRTILEFVAGELRVNISDEKFSHIHSFNDLNETEKKKIWRFPMVVRDLEDSTTDEVRDLFQRLNKYSVNLNDQELRKARFKGEFLKTIDELGEDDFWTTSGLFSPNDFRRMLDLEYLGILLSTMIGGIYNRKDRLDEFYVNYEEEFDEKEYYVSKFSHILEIISSTLPDIKRTTWKNKANFYTLFQLVDTNSAYFRDPEILPKFSTILNNFVEKTEQAKNNPENSDEKFISYLDASTYGTNDKEKRQRRFKILSSFFQEFNLSATEING